MANNFLIEVTPVKPDDTITTLRMSRAGGSAAGVYLDNKEWKPLLETLPTFSLNLLSNGQLQTVAISYGDLEFICSDAYGNEEWSSYDWSNALATCWYGEDGQQFSEYQQVFAGRVSGFNRSGIFATVALLGSEADLQRPALHEEYAGTGGVEGGAGIRGNIKPRAHGYCRNVTPVQIDTVNVVYQVHGYGPIQGIPAVYDFAQALAPSSANVSTYQELIDLDLQPGQWATCNAHGLFRLGGTTDKKLTCDVQGGLYNGTYTHTVKGIAQQLIREVQPSATFGNWGAFADAQWCFYATDAQTVHEIVNRAVYEAGGYLLPDGMGRWQVGDFYAPVSKGQLRSDRSTLPLVIEHEETTSTGPIWKASVGHSRCWSVHTTAEISPSIIDLEGYVTDEALNEARQDFEQTKADVAAQLTRLDAMVADGVLDRAEKKYWVQQYAVETTDWNKLNSDAAQWSVASQLAIFNVRFNDLTGYLNTLMPAWNDGSQDTLIDRAAYRAAWEGLYSAKIALTQAIAEGAKWENINGAGKPEDNATKGAPDGTPVGNKPAEDVIDAITDANGNLIQSEQLKTDIAAADVIARDLQATYGSTASAAASADAAAQHEANALTAASNAAQAKADADAIRNDAAQKANNSEASRLASEAAKTASELARDQAQYQAGQAGGSANAAAGYAGTANQKADEAGQSAAAALASSVTASTTAQALMPSHFGDLKNWSGDWVNASGSLVDDSRFAAYDAGVGRILDVYNAPHFAPHITTKGRVPLVRDKVYQITVRWALTSNQLASPVNATLFAVGIKPNSSQTGDFWNNIATNCQISEGQTGWGSFWAVHTLTVHTNSLIDQGCQWTRPLFRIDNQGHFAIQSIEIRDITGEYRASGSADAAANSASSAAIESGKAGNSASAASGSATNAKTSEDAAWQHRQGAAGHESTAGQYRSDAETFRNQASNSATNASGSASTASEQAGVATSAADRSGQSANAASGSASSAASSAGAAGQSAGAAQQAEVSANTVAQALMPSDFQNIKNWTWNWGEGNHDLASDSRHVAFDEPSLGRILRVTNNPPFTPHIASKGRVTLIRDHKYRITVKWHLVGQQPNENPVGGWIFFIGIRPNSAQTGDYWNNISTGVSFGPGQPGWGSGGWATHTLEVDANTLLDQGCQWTRPLFRLDSQGVYDIQSIEFRDITGEANAKGSADAAAGSASTAAIRASEAGQSASAANSSQTNAATNEYNSYLNRQAAAGHESAAWTYRNEASTSASNAAGSASTASQQAGLASNSANAAGQSANAAAQQASTAKSRANDASQSANAASSSSVTASNRATGNIVSRGEFDANSGKGLWSGSVNVGYASDIGQYVLGQSNRDSYDGELVAGSWSNRRFRVSGEVQAWGAYQAQIGIHCQDNGGNNQWYIQGVANAGSWYTPFSFEFALPANIKSARGILVSDGPHDASGHGLNWRSVRIEDITSEFNAWNSAQAASSSYSSAQYEAGQSWQHAQSASGSANTANIKSGEAAASANAAAGSASWANDRASASASSATLAATFSTGGGNLLPESSFETGVPGWYFHAPTPGSYSSNVALRDHAGDDWRPTEEHVVGINQVNGNPDDWAQIYVPNINVEGGRWYELSALVAGHRSDNEIKIEWSDTNGNRVNDEWEGRQAGAQGGRYIRDWAKRWLKRRAPDNAVRATLVFTKWGTYGGNSDSHMWVCRPMFRETSEQANSPCVYAPSNSRATQAAQQATISQQGSAIATAQNSLANLTTVVQSGSPNLLRNGGFAQGMNYWSQTHGGWNPHVSGGWGRVANRAGDWSGDYCYIESENVPIFGNATYTLSADSLYYLYGGSGHCYTEMVWFDGNNNVISNPSGAGYGASHDYSINGTGRNTHRLQATSPGHASYVRARGVNYKAPGSSVNVIGWRQFKLEQGDMMTPYSNEASVTTIAETVTNVDGKANQALARAATRLDVNGYITGWEMANNGQSGNMVVNVDSFQLVKPGGGARTEFVNGCMKVFDENGILRGRFGNLSA